MSAKLRFHTMVKHSGCIYNAADAVRTVRLMEALDDITEKIDPAGPEQWRMVENDARRILNVWLSREQTAAAGVLARELLDSLRELAAAPVPALPHLEIIDKAPAPAPAPVLEDKEVAEDADVEEEVAEDADVEVEVEVEGEDDGEETEEDVDVEVEVDGEETEEDVEEEDEVVVQKLPAPEPEVDADVEDEGEADDNEVVEPAADEENADEEEEGMEVEKRTIRGRDYWIDINTNKLYAVIDDDDVGDEVGAIVNGRPVFTA